MSGITVKMIYGSDFDEVTGRKLVAMSCEGNPLRKHGYHLRTSYILCVEGPPGQRPMKLSKARDTAVVNESDSPLIHVCLLSIGAHT